MTTYFAVCKCGKVIEEPTSWHSITEKISMLGLKLDGKTVVEIPIPDNVQSLIQCKLAMMVGGSTFDSLHILGYDEHIDVFDFNTGKKVDFSTKQLDLTPHSIKQ